MSDADWTALTAEIVGLLEDWRPDLNRAIRRCIGLPSERLTEVYNAVGNLGNLVAGNDPNQLLFETCNRIAADSSARMFAAILQGCDNWLDGLAKCDHKDEDKARDLVQGAWDFYNQYPHQAGELF